jgi:ubiquinone/menaquinone biosynthesis C-methylase UbiE
MKALSISLCPWCHCGEINSMFYDKFAIVYDKAIAPFEKRFLSNWRKETMSHLPENGNLLEIGAGTGLNFRFYPNCKHAVASELSCEMLSFAKTKITTENLSLTQTDAEKLPFADNSFDAALATLVFCAIPNPENAFSELRRVVKPGGRVVLLEHVRPSGLLGYVLDAISFFTVWLIEDHFNRETAKTATESGLRVLEVKKKFFGIVNLIICENNADTKTVRL